ncbi:F0F1 ATP synthase subunit A [Novosphingobium sp. Gsoil 351]|uniref:F0F1 ATP synthase subunit A n=1 Tax=Novosphingobium sp. Gsoil 351 TaxID=2675225 RepID=UPI0012B4FA7C|nr:F0F1 ATP synthase subunit A [Novosphingobium sp. Gsoil 351]QGN55585.1 F0F1 ATP synthase subunit A [Novosphingobium sp. Gsoil 351]
MAAEGKMDPMHQFAISPIGGGELTASPFQFTNSSLWMMIVLVAIIAFMWGGTRRQLVPGRWQAAVEGLTGFVGGIATQSIGAEGRRYLPWIFTAFVFILFSNWIGAMPLAITGAHPFTVTSQFTITGFMSILSFAIVLGVGFWKHGLHFFSLFVPHGAPLPVKLFVAPIEFVSFLVRPFSLGLRPFVAMFAGHVLLEVFGNFVVQGLNAGSALGWFISALCFVFLIFVNALELLVGGIQAYVFALLTSLYIKDAVHLH